MDHIVISTLNANPAVSPDRSKQREAKGCGYSARAVR
jgi:hypothetical protein